MSDHDDHDAVVRLWPAEWWERLADRLGPPPRVVLATAGLGVVLGLVALAGGAASRAGLLAWLGAAWAAVLAFVALRTATLSGAAYALTFLGGMIWALVTAAALGLLAATVGRGVQSEGAIVVLAAVGEDALKLVPLLALAVLAPRRLHRFAVADAVLVGVALGAGFLAVEEAVRRMVRVWALGVVPDGFTTFSVLGVHPGGEGPLYPGHHVATGVVAGALALGVHAVSRARRTHRAGPLLWAAAVAPPLLLWWALVARHAVMNAAALETTAPGLLRVSDALAPDVVTAPMALAVTALVAMVVDASRLARWGDAAFESHPPPAWYDRAVDGCLVLESRGGPWRHVAVTGEAAAHLALVVGRDARQVTEVLRAGEKWPARVRAARTLVEMQRRMREIAYHLDAGDPAPRGVRTLAVVLLTVSLLAALVAAPAAASTVQGAGDTLADWLAGQLVSWGRWWPGLSGWHQLLALLAGAAALGLGATAGRTPDAVLAVTGAAAPPSFSGVDGALSAELQAFVADPHGWAVAQAERLRAAG